MKKLSFAVALAAAFVCTLTAGFISANALTFRNCEDLLFPGEVNDVDYSCDLTFEGGNYVPDVCVNFSTGETSSDFTMFSPKFPAKILNAPCSCEVVKFWSNLFFDASSHSFVCSSYGTDVAASLNILWTGGAIKGQLFAANLDEVIYMKCTPDPGCLDNIVCIQNIHTGEYLSDVITQLYPSCSTGEKWRLIPSGKDYCIQNVSNGKYLSDVITQLYPTCSTGEKWRLIPDDGGGYCIQNAYIKSLNGGGFLSDVITELFPRCSTGEKWDIQ